jgi:hypothetical protein
MRRFSLVGLAVSAWLLAVPSAALALDVDLDLASVEVEPSTREVILSGTVTCTAGAELTIGWALAQGPATVGGFQTFTCTGVEQEWELREPVGTPRVHPGPAVLDFGFTAELGGESIASGRSLEIFVAPAGAPWLFGIEPEPEA